MVDISLHYEIQFIELGGAQILMSGFEEDLRRYNQRLGMPTPHLAHPTK